MAVVKFEKVNLEKIMMEIYGAEGSVAKSQASRKVKGCREFGYMVDTIVAKEILQKMTEGKGMSKGKEGAERLLKDFPKLVERCQGESEVKEAFDLFRYRKAMQSILQLLSSEKTPEEIVLEIRDAVADADEEAAAKDGKDRE
jgi:hypothetical protein